MEKQDVERNVIRLLMEQERAVGSFYQVLAGKHPDDAGFWLTIAEEEEGHAKLLEKLEEQILSGQLKIVLGTIMKTSLPVSIGKVKEMVSWAQGNEMTRKQCIAESLSLEHQLLEEKFYEVVGSDTVWLREFKVAMKKSIDIHLNRLKSAYQQVLDEEAAEAADKARIAAEAEAAAEAAEAEASAAVQRMAVEQPVEAPPAAIPAPVPQAAAPAAPVPAVPAPVEKVEPQAVAPAPAPAPEPQAIVSEPAAEVSVKQVEQKAVASEPQAAHHSLDEIPVSQKGDPVSDVVQEALESMSGFTALPSDAATAESTESACDLVALYTNVKTTIDDAREAERTYHAKLEALEPFLVHLEAALKHRHIDPL